MIWQHRVVSASAIAVVGGFAVRVTALCFAHFGLADSSFDEESQFATNRCCSNPYSANRLP